MGRMLNPGVINESKLLGDYSVAWPDWITPDTFELLNFAKRHNLARSPKLYRRE